MTTTAGDAHQRDHASLKWVSKDHVRSFRASGLRSLEWWPRDIPRSTVVRLPIADELQPGPVTSVRNTPGMAIVHAWPEDDDDDNGGDFGWAVVLVVAPGGTKALMRLEANDVSFTTFGLFNSIRAVLASLSRATLVGARLHTEEDSRGRYATVRATLQPQVGKSFYLDIGCAAIP